ncbi:hypothetical protein ACRALDRAFT_207111 [Sodiomyces alcalophilus JCM 7366]|uniref:uncharacterized protein n=1 Tax=Sodiomyces alcalophilus JCM 7366 TaxID=591952 RepID=UPI0039B4119D
MPFNNYLKMTTTPDRSMILFSCGRLPQGPNKSFHIEEIHRVVEHSKASEECETPHVGKEDVSKPPWKRHRQETGPNETSSKSSPCLRVMTGRGGPKLRPSSAARSTPLPVELGSSDMYSHDEAFRQNQRMVKSLSHQRVTQDARWTSCRDKYKKRGKEKGRKKIAKECQEKYRLRTSHLLMHMLVALRHCHAE